MGRNNKSYHRSLKDQAYTRLTEMLDAGVGTSKKTAKLSGETADRIHSFSTYKTYKKHIGYFCDWMTENHPDVTTMKKAKKYVNEWLRFRADQTNADGTVKYSAWTINTEAAALSKFYNITPDDSNRFIPPQRKRSEIKRSRSEAVRDKNFSVTNNAELINFCRGTGLRRAGISSVKGKNLWTKDQIEAEIERIEKIPEGQRSAADSTRLSIALDTRAFKKPDPKKGDAPDPDYFIEIKEKGGRIRYAPIVGDHVSEIVERFQHTAPEEKVWQYVSSNADIHGYRGDYAATVYKQYARELSEIPYDKINKGTGKPYQSEVYSCRKDESGKQLDKRAMLIASKALGHNRISIIADNYLRNL